MDRKQIKKRIEEKLDFWGALLFFNAIALLIISLFALIDTISIKAALILISILALINLIGYIHFSMYAYDIADERYGEFLKREKYWQNLTLKERIKDYFALIWILSPILVTIILFMMPLNLLTRLLIGLIYMLIWLIFPLHLIL